MGDVPCEGPPTIAHGVGSYKRHTMTSSLSSSRNAPAKATEQNAKASPDFAAKLAETQALLSAAGVPHALG